MVYPAGLKEMDNADRNWKLSLSGFKIEFGDRLTDHQWINPPVLTQND
jgi:hypothetical protein